jgi:hypothetical protein
MDMQCILWQPYLKSLYHSSIGMPAVGHYNCLLIKKIKCYINCQPREVCLFQRQSHTVYAQSQKKSKVVVKVTLITPLFEQTKVLL